ncbi:TetR/AcrR family transcriptional regulator [Arthrobacter sp. ISL-48]|uniref:TetR/AcrR family transcriptional regulator n=1 Tax=Arthrobacter sp. ISL-48 TaxID=2819110 RepID=UPI001BEC5378|nr:TetR/AcrR family transcriptional regulator [Arthrobacter sp. ISL-48]MBT2534517.1 TetR/AcrR family transcriptional regulator [Arthrobacter sp. ISL-48]
MTQAPASSPEPTRSHRRKAQTRAALVGAAQSFLAQGKTNSPVLEITQAADVGIGSFYNHFESKEQLFEAAVEHVTDLLGAVLDQLTTDVEDPAIAFATSFRLTGRFHRREPELSKVILHSALGLLGAETGLAPRVRRDIQAGVESGRFTMKDIDVAVVCAVGAATFLGQLLHTEPDRDDAEATDQATEALLRMLGLPADEARAICSGPLPELHTAGLRGAADQAIT